MKIQSTQPLTLLLVAGLFLVTSLTSGVANGQFNVFFDRGDLAPISFTISGDSISDCISAGPSGVLSPSGLDTNHGPDHFKNSHVCANWANARLSGWIVEYNTNVTGAGITVDIHAEQLIVGVIFGEPVRVPAIVYDGRGGFDFCFIVSGG